MPADGLTKLLPAQWQALFIKQLNLVNISTQLSGNSGGDSSNLSGHSQLGAEPADLKDGDGIAYFGNSWHYLQLQQVQIRRMSTLRRCVGQLSYDWPVFCVISLLNFQSVSTLFSYIRTTVGSAISPHSLLYIMTVDFADRMTTAILHKNYHTLFDRILAAITPIDISVLWRPIRAQSRSWKVLAEIKAGYHGWLLRLAITAGY